MPHPTDAQSVQRLIGFVTYLAKFMSRLSEVREGLQGLIDKDMTWHRLPEQQLRESSHSSTNPAVVIHTNSSQLVAQLPSSQLHCFGSLSPL